MHNALDAPISKGLKSLVILVCWEIWNERNARIFNSTEAPSFTVAERRLRERLRLEFWPGETLDVSN